MGLSYILVVVGIILAKGIGFYRDVAFSGVFGTGLDADIYFQVFNLVNLIFAGVGVALSTLVIKNMNKAENRGNEKGYAASFLRKSFISMCGVSVLFALLAKPIIKYLLLPGLSEANVLRAVKLMYIMVPSLVFVVIAYIISGVLQNEKVFFITSIMSLPFNAVIIARLLLPNPDLYSVGAFTTIGWFLHIAILLPSFCKKGYGFFAKSTLRKTAKPNPEIIWIFISNMMYQLLFYADRAFVSDRVGMASTFSYASNLFVIVASIFVVAMSTVFFPAISKNYEEGKTDYVNGLIKYILTVMAAIFLPFLLVVGLFGENIIRLVYERGDFTAESTRAVSTIFFIYSLGVVGYIAQELFNKILYIAGKYKSCVLGTIGAVIFNILTNFAISFLCPDILLFGIDFKSVLICASSSVFLIIYFLVTAAQMKKIIGTYLDKALIRDFIKILLSGVIAFIAYLAFYKFTPRLITGRVAFLIPLCVCGAVYIASLLFTGILIKLITRKGAKTNENN